MGAQISVRRRQEPLLKQLNREARKRRVRRSDLVREALEAFLGGKVARIDSLPYERVHDLVGSLSGGLPDLGAQHRKYLRDLIGERR